jgi:lysophospholipase L1-like esterase
LRRIALVRRWVLRVVVLVGVVWLAGAVLNRASSRVAFMGDSLTQGWGFPRANLGVFGQTTEQMAARFAGQVGGHGYREVVILGGTNDTLLGIDPEATWGNLGRMVEMARAEGVEPMLAEIPPIYRDGGRYLSAVRRLNAGIVRLAEAKGVKLVDYFGALEGHREAYSDGTHLKRRGYLRMELALIKVENPF